MLHKTSGIILMIATIHKVFCTLMASGWEDRRFRPARFYQGGLLSSLRLISGDLFIFC
jgi:hypothetical protein